MSPLKAAAAVVLSTSRGHEAILTVSKGFFFNGIGFNSYYAYDRRILSLPFLTLVYALTWPLYSYNLEPTALSGA